MPRPRPLPGQRIDYLLSTREQREPFAECSPALHCQEALDMWGETDVWAAASGRARDYALEEWTTIAAEQRSWERRVVDVYTSGEPADSELAIALAEEHRASIERWYFTCPPQLHREIMEALLDDAGFRLRYEGLATGAADFIRAAVYARSARDAMA